MKKAIAILGIDPAWEGKNTSGVALIRFARRKWQYVKATHSFAAFMKSEAPTRPRNSFPPVVDLLLAARKLLGEGSVGLVCIDMPLSLRRITGRRTADNAISSLFGGRWCGTHSPIEKKLEPRAGRIRRQFGAHRFRLATTRMGAGTCPALIEVYPHTALLSLLHERKRISYKIDSSAEHRVRRNWDKIICALGREIANIPYEEFEFPSPGSRRSEKKEREDKLDALICAWVGIQYINGRISAHGDDKAAIWTPPLP